MSGIDIDEMLKSIAVRYCCASFDDEPVSREDLDAIIRVDDKMSRSEGQKTWRLAATADLDLISRIRDTSNAVMTQQSSARDVEFLPHHDMFHNAQAMVIVASQFVDDTATASLAAGRLVENVCRNAQEIGLGTLVSGYMVNAFHMWNRPEVVEFLKEFQVPNEYELLVGILVGHPQASTQETTSEVS